MDSIFFHMDKSAGRGCKSSSRLEILFSYLPLHRLESCARMQAAQMSCRKKS